MNYAAIKIADCSNGTGVRTVLFVSGCTHHCKGCFQPETWDFNFGKPYTENEEKFILNSLENSYVDGLTILGGEPMESRNQPAILPLIEKTHEMGKTIWIYSGYTWEEITDKSNPRCHVPGVTDRILRNIDILVDGEFHEKEKDITLKFKGSSNQRILNVQESLKAGRPVLAAI